MDVHPHTFVVQGDLTKLACDLLLIPTDESFVITGHWPDFGAPVEPPGWGDQGVRVTRAVPEQGVENPRLVCWVNVGTTPEQADVKWLREGIRQALEEAATSLRGRTLGVNGRALPLVGLPPFGTGAGGFGTMRGEALDAILAECDRAAHEHRFDTAIVCWRRSDYAALQARRLERADGSEPLPEDLRKPAARLGEMARAGNLTLFLGAGVSQPAGLPSWNGLIDLLTKDSKTYNGRVPELEKIPVTEAARLLQEDLGEKPFQDALEAALDVPRHALGHALLASLRVMETITTNFDTLYDQACQQPHSGQLRTLPWDRAEPGQPWLLKMHGDVSGGHMVLTQDEFLSYDEQWRPLASVVQAAMMTSHVLFVGYSLKDANFVRLGRDVSRLLGRMNGGHGHASRKVGTLLTLSHDPLQHALWQRDLELVPMAPSGTKDLEAARLLDVFLDGVAMHAAAGEPSYRLDRRYRALLDPADQAVADKLAAVAQSLGDDNQGRWRELRDVLQRYGYREDSYPAG